MASFSSEYARPLNIDDAEPEFDRISKDNKGVLARVNLEDFKLLRLVKGLVEQEVRRVLDFMGLNINEDTPVSAIKRQLAINNLSIVHAVFKQNPELDGWHIIEGGETIMIIRPKIVRDGSGKTTVTVERKVMD